MRKRENERVRRIKRKREVQGEKVMAALLLLLCILHLPREGNK